MAGIQIQTQVGAAAFSNGATPNNLRQDRSGGLVTQDAHGRFQEAAMAGALYSGGMTLTSINNATFSTGTLGNTATPIVGVYNPLNSGKNLVILQVKMQTVITAATTTGYGALMYCVSTNNGAISTGNAPHNRLTLSQVGSVAKDMSGVALTGLTNNLVVWEAAGFGASNGNYSQVGTAVGIAPSPGVNMVDNLDGSVIVPPGGVFAVLCTTNPPVACSAASGILWEEVPV